MRRVFGVVLSVVVVAGVACSGGHSTRTSPFSPAPTEGARATVGAVPSTAVPTLAAIPAGSASQALREGRFSDAAVRFGEEASGAPNAAAKSEALLGAGRARFELGDRAGAIASFRDAIAAAPPGSQEARRAAYLLALRLDDAGRGAEAVEALRALADTGGTDALQPLLDAELARAAALAGDGALSEQAFARAVAHPEATSALRAAAYRGLAAAARVRDDEGALSAALSKLVRLGPTPAERYELATIFLAARQLGLASEQLAAIVLQSPESRFALFALADLPKAGAMVDVGAEGLVYYRRGLYGQAKAILGAARGDKDASIEERAFRGFYFAASLEDSGDAAGAIEAYDQVIDSVRYVHKSRYWAARATEGTGDLRGASERYQALALATPKGEFTTESAFRAGYTMFRAGDARAAQVWSSLGVSRDPRLLYWKGRALEELGEKAAAATAYREAMAADSRSFFGQEAAARLKPVTAPDARYVSLPSPVPTLDWAEFEAWLRVRGVPARVDPVPSVARELALVGLLAEAGAVVEEFGNSGDPWRQFVTMKASYELGLPSVGARLAVRLRTNLGVEYEDAPVLLARMAYPLDHITLLEQESRRNGLDPLFFAALIRQESFWDATAVSHADAYGLTQVIPETGQGIANALDVSSFEPSDLLRPAVALKFGAFYIGEQLKRYESPYVALSAYNAGPAAASRWSATARSAADFVETIDYAETQAYVQLIMEAYAHYKYAWRER